MRGCADDDSEVQAIGYLERGRLVGMTLVGIEESALALSIAAGAGMLGTCDLFRFPQFA
jgi:hypothetical protein